MTDATEPQVTEADAARMADMRRAGLSLQDIAEDYGITRVKVYEILRPLLSAGELRATAVAELPEGLRDALPEDRQVRVIPLEPKPSAEQQAASSRTRRRTLIAIAGVFVVAIGVTIGLLVSSSGGSKGGFYNMTTLENSVQSQVSTDPAYGIGATVEGCSMTGANTAQCVISGGAGGQPSGMNITIASNGQSWVQQ